jgi:cyclase
VRVIAKLDVKPPNVVKPVHFEGLRKIGTPVDLASKYFAQGADEIFYIDIVASLYQREILFDYIRETAQCLFVPFAVGGGVRTLEDMTRLFHNGADKIVINTHVLQVEPELIEKAAHLFGSQSVVVNVEAKRWEGWWECYSDCGRERSGKSVLDWVKEAENRGSGEILLQSVDCDGRQSGFDLELIKQVKESVSIPVVAASGAGTLDDIVAVAREAKPDAVALASILHYNKLKVEDVKQRLRSEGL